jgi:hypothetical protein
MHNRGVQHPTMKILNAAASLFALAATVAFCADADNAPFNLAGPKIDVRVTRGSVTLPIAQVPNLVAGDKLWVKADLPPSQSNHLLLIVAFLRGTTNEPPDNWFTEIDTWDKKAAEGTQIVVPAGAEQAIMFIAPETGGDFKTLRSAVKGKPGLFIRADADLNEASFEQQRIERYLAAMKTVPADNPKAIKDRSARLATTLALKPDDKCFALPVDQQVSCLTQSSAPLLLTDGHGQSIAEAMSTGASSDFINAAAATPAAVGSVGVYSAYVGAVVDLVHLASLLRTAQYEYIPGIAFPQDSTLNLKLNAPPSFHNPKTVIVIGLPAIEAAKPPPLKLQHADEVECLLQSKMTLPLAGAPLVFATGYAHDLILHLNRTGAPTDLPLKPDAYEGGLQVAKAEVRHPISPPIHRSPAQATKPGTSSDLIITGTIEGYWGFDSFQGPTVTLQQVDGKDWNVLNATQLLAGKENKLTLKADGTACVEKIALADDKDKKVDVSFKPDPGDGGKASKDTLDLDVSLKSVDPGGYALNVQQFGAAHPEKVPVTAYNAGIQLDDIKIHTGDDRTVLTGAGLESVVSVKIGQQTFLPAGSGNTGKSVQLEAKSGVSPANNSDATVKLKDGRTMTVKVAAEAARPGLKLLSFKATPAQQAGSLPVTLGAKDDIPLDGELTFVVQTADVFPRTQTIEVATANEAVHTALSLSGNSLVLQDEHTAIATLDPLKTFGQSAFGKLQMRPVAADGTHGDWTPLGILVRTPRITAIHCTAAAPPACSADGRNFFLVQAFGADKGFAKPMQVPTGFAETTLTVPTPTDGTTLYLKLRDDPGAVASVTLPAPIQTAPPQTAAPQTAAPQTAPPTPTAAASQPPAPAAASAPTTPPQPVAPSPAPPQ